MTLNTKPTDRQLTILRLAADGLTTEQIAQQVGYSRRTINGDLITLFHEHGFRSRAQAVAAAIRAGWI